MLVVGTTRHVVILFYIKENNKTFLKHEHTHTKVIFLKKIFNGRVNHELDEKMQWKKI